MDPADIPTILGAWPSAFGALGIGGVMLLALRLAVAGRRMAAEDRERAEQAEKDRDAERAKRREAEDELSRSRAEIIGLRAELRAARHSDGT